jgi:hypothetical protein
MAAVIRSLDATLDTQCTDSGLFFDIARNGFEQHGRGAIVTMFPNIEALDNEEQNMSFYLPRKELEDGMYNPDMYYVQ